MKLGYMKNYIDGKLVDAGNKEKKEIICPATEEAVAEIAWGNEKDAENALKSSEKGFAAWSQTTKSERIEWMNKLAVQVKKDFDHLRECVMLEMGKPWEDTHYDVNMLLDCLEFFSGELKHSRDELIPDLNNTHTHMIIKQPLGPVVALLAWNFPVLNIAYKVGPALASGCSIIIRPSVHSPLSALAFGEICQKVGLPAGVVNVVCGDSATLGESLVKSTIPRMITCIGSSQTGKRLIELSATSIKKFSLELGGNAPVIVFDDVDVKKVVDGVVGLKFANCGQICVSPNRIFVHKNIYDEFLDEAKKAAGKIKLESGKAKGQCMGPLVSSSARERVMGLLEKSKKEGARVVFGGEIPKEDKYKKGFWFMPTILGDVKPDMSVAKEEIFGPILPVIKFEKEEEVIKMANDTEFGLAAYIYTNDLKRGLNIPEKINFGSVIVNDVKYEVYLPHGGFKESGIGKDCSHLSLDEYFSIKRISILK